MIFEQSGKADGSCILNMVDLTTSFADSGADAITRSINLQSDEVVSHLPWNEFKDYYDVDRTVDEIIKGDYKRVILVQPPFSLSVV
jgi:diphthamide biosynthesis protein 2